MQWRAAHEFLTPPYSPSFSLPSAEFKSQKLLKLCLWLDGNLFHAPDKEKRKLSQFFTVYVNETNYKQY